MKKEEKITLEGMATGGLYCEAFKGRFGEMRQLAKDRNKGLEEVIALFTQRLECESQYGKALRKIGATSHSLVQGYIRSP